MSWQTRPLNEIADFVLGKMLDQAKNRGELLAYLANINVRWGDFDLSDLREMRFEPHEVERYGLKPGDIVMCEGGEPGRCALWKGQREGMMIQKALHRIRPRAGLDSTFLYYAFLTIGKQNGFAPFLTGATIKHLPREQLARVPIRFPEWSEQRAIAVVLSAYDDLIATNQRRIALLEDAARRLYRKWFVHLRFPGHESVPVKDGVLEGWRKTPMTSVADFVNGFAFKPEHLGDSGLPVVKIPELRSGITSKTPFNPGHIVPQRNHITTGDVIFSWSATLLVNEWGEGPALLNQHLFKVIPHNELHKRLVRFAVEAAIPELTGHAVGATMQHIRRSALDNHLMLVPDDITAAAFAGQADPMMDAVLNLTAQNRELTQARDLLLPKLMSGQLDVSGIALPDEVAA
jgi:Restriction endonuclease S subunits